MTVLDEAWKRQRRWSALADARGEEISRWRLVDLTLVVAGALGGTLAAQSWLPGAVSTAFGVTGAVALVGAAQVQSTRLGVDQLRERTTARAAAETLKSAVIQYLARVTPYDGADRDAELNAVLARVSDQGADLSAAMRDATPKPRDLPPISDVADYVSARVEEQRDYLLDRIRRHRRGERRWRRAEVAMTLVAAALAATGGVLGGTGLSAWVAVAATVAAAFGAHLTGGQYARLAVSYAQTVDELERLLAGFDPATATPREATAFVTTVEAVLARQNEGWVSSLSPQP